MSSKSAKQRATVRGIDPQTDNRVPPPSDDEGLDVIEWRPDWGPCCDLCGQTPCMVGMSGGVVVAEATRCAECLDEDGATRFAIGCGY